jgi:serine/threonine protein kinase
MNVTACPEEHELLELHADGSAGGAIRGHVDSCPACQQRLARLGAELANLRDFFREATFVPQQTVSHRPAPVESPSLATVGKYVVLESLGGGGQADVYRAAHPTLGKEVVVKLAREAGGDRSALAAEGKVLAELNHPGLVRVYDLDFHEGCPFLVMEYVPATDLRRYAAQHALNPFRAAELVAKAARALAVAHRRGVVHQDLKPTNILVAGDGNPRIIDFGMARLTHGWADPASQPDGGTASYMAPEQARGESDRVDPRSDLFALGGVLYFLLTGGPPFPGGTFEERLDRAKRCDFDAAALGAVPPRLRAMCLRAMAADPADRYATAEEFAIELERFGSRPNRRAVLLVATGITLAALGVGWWQFGRRKPEPVERQPENPPAPAPPKPVPPPPLLENPLTFAHRRKGFSSKLPTFADLANVIPFRSGDELAIHVAVPNGLRATLFAVSKGAIKQLASGAESFQYPPAGLYTRFGGDTGTEMILACWRRSGPATAEEIGAGWKPDPWPAIAFDCLLQMTREKVEPVDGSRPLDDPRNQETPEGVIKRQLDALRLKLRDKFDHILGVAFLYKK